MRILKVIHGYPMRYNAGSEVYSQTLCNGLAERHEVHVFTREEDAFAPDFNLRKEQDADDKRITLHLVNNPRLKDRYRADGIDQRFAQVMDEVRPDIVHVGHLNHLSTSLLKVAASRNVPIVFTLHDYWLMCPRGQFMQMFPKDGKTLWAVCDGQDDRKYAERCYSRYFSGAPEETEDDIRYWTDWVSRRMGHVREMAGLVDMFVAPARYLRDRFHNDFGLPEEKLIYLDYGFDRSRLGGRKRVEGEPFTFGYIGTHIPAKGIHDLIRAFGLLEGNACLRIWGRPRGQDTDSLRRIADDLPEETRARVEWRKEYRNQEIVEDVFNHCDAIVVPSIWMENSPLVIHEAQQARVPVVTANVGGMAEYVHHEVNGLLFEHRAVESMAEQMQRLVDSPDLATRLGKRGYPFSENGEIPSVEQHVQDIEHLYEKVLAEKRQNRCE
ncbi:glycosyltransferase [Lautropia mirabilis]